MYTFRSTVIANQYAYVDHWIVTWLRCCSQGHSLGCEITTLLYSSGMHAAVANIRNRQCTTTWEAGADDHGHWRLVVQTGTRRGE